MVKVVIESDNSINVSVKRFEDPTTKLLKDMNGDDGDEDNEKNVVIDVPKKCIS